jgi:hypothetical protein
MTDVAVCQKKFGDPWFSLCNTVFTRLSERGGGGGGTCSYGKVGPTRTATDVSARQNSRCVRKVSQKLEKIMFLSAVTSAPLEDGVFVVQTPPCRSLCTYYSPQVNPKTVHVKLDWKWKSVVGNIGYKFKTTTFRLISLFMRYFYSADNVLVNLFTMMPVERSNTGPAHRLCVTI